MSNRTNHTPAFSANGIDYFVCKSTAEPNNRSFGIMAVSETDVSDTGIAENLFFTEAEARAYCEFFAQNQVFPCTLREVLANILIL